MTHLVIRQDVCLDKLVFLAIKTVTLHVLRLATRAKGLERSTVVVAPHLLRSGSWRYLYRQRRLRSIGGAIFLAVQDLCAYH